MNKSYYTIIGFLLFIIGFLSLILSISGIELRFLTWLNLFGNVGAFVIRILMIVVGIVIAALSTNNWRED